MGAIIFDYPAVPFTVVRGYCPAVHISSDYNIDPFWDGQTIEWESSAGYTFRIKVTDEFYNFSTAAYTLDRLFDPAGSSIDCHLFPCFDVVLVRWIQVLNDGRYGVELQPLSSLTTKRHLTLPPPPPGYWHDY